MIIESWNDVQSKAYMLLQSNSVDILQLSTFSVLCYVNSTEQYETYVNNKATVYKDNDLEHADWYCTCPWGNIVNHGLRPHDGIDSTGSVRVNNRMCSHAYACYVVLQAYRKQRKNAN